MSDAALLAELQDALDGAPVDPPPRVIMFGFTPAQVQALIAALRDKVSPWQKIESAPEMKIILLFAATDRRPDGTVANWKIGTGSFNPLLADERCTGWEWSGWLLKSYDHHPTHWMPLPAAPEET